MVDCGFCTREIIKEHEKGGELFIKDGKPMCMICRAVKLSRFRSDIESSGDRMRDDLRAMNSEFERDEFENIIHIAAEAQEQVELKAKA